MAREKTRARLGKGKGRDKGKSGAARLSVDPEWVVLTGDNPHAWKDPHWPIGMFDLALALAPDAPPWAGDLKFLVVPPTHPNDVLRALYDAAQDAKLSRLAAHLDLAATLIGASNMAEDGAAVFVRTSLSAEAARLRERLVRTWVCPGCAAEIPYTLDPDRLDVVGALQAVRRAGAHVGLEYGRGMLLVTCADCGARLAHGDDIMAGARPIR